MLINVAGLLDPQPMLNALGPWALLAILGIVFAECGLLVGFFLPGDSLLFTAGLLVASGFIATPIAVVVVLVCIAAIAGNLVGYWIGYKLGPGVFRKPDSKYFRAEYVERTGHFFDKYGGGAIILARFVPIVRTFITVMAGVSRMDLRRYTIFSIIGGVLWGISITMLGYYLGNIEFIRKNIEFIVVGMVVLSVIPIVVELRRNARRRSQANEA
jgi:membrane-associated protein